MCIICEYNAEPLPISNKDIQGCSYLLGLLMMYEAADKLPGHLAGFCAAHKAFWDLALSTAPKVN